MRAGKSGLAFCLQPPASHSVFVCRCEDGRWLPLGTAGQFLQLTKKHSRRCEEETNLAEDVDGRKNSAEFVWTESSTGEATGAAELLI